MAFQLSLSVRERMEQEARERGLTKTMIAKQSGLRPEDVSRLMGGKPGVGSKRAQQLCDWFGLDLEGGQAESMVSRRGYWSLPAYPSVVMQLLPNAEPIEVTSKWLPPAGNMALVTVKSDAMTPTLWTNDVLAVDYGSGFTENGLYAVTMSGMNTIARLQKRADSYRIVFDNQQYEEMDSSEFAPGQFAVLGRVVMTVRPNL